MSIVEDSPSAGRRKALKEADAANQLRVLGSCPLAKYINIADRLLDHFQDALDGRRLDEAYIFGLRFANLCLSSLPQHPEWKHGTVCKDTKRLTSQVGDVLCMMDIIKQRMDAEELMKRKAEIIAKEEEESRKKEAEARRQHQLEEALHREQKMRDTLEEERAQFLAEQRYQREEKIKQKLVIAEKKEAVTKKKEIERSAMAKLQAMQARMSSTKEHSVTSKVTTAVDEIDTETLNSKKTTTKRVSTPKSWFSKGEKKCNSNSGEEKAVSSAPCPTVSSETKDGTNALCPVSIPANEVNMIKITPANITKEDNWAQSIERKSLPGERKEKKLDFSSSTEYEESEKKTSFDTISTTASTAKPNKEDTDSTRSTKAKKSVAISFFKSKISAAKSKDSTTTNLKKKNQLSVSLNSENPCGRDQFKNERVPSSTMTSVNGAVSTTTDTIVAAQQAPASRKEKATIAKLQRAISVQEDRLEDIEGKQIPSLLNAAKKFLKEDNKKEALKCLAHKKRLERQVDIIKAAVFNMETQMFMLESAFEDRYVKKALDEAATAIAGFQQSIGDPKAVIVDLTKMTAPLPELDVGDATDEELMEELEEWLSPEDKKNSEEKKDSYADDDISLLSMPAFLPAVPTVDPASPSVDQIRNAVMG